MKIPGLLVAVALSFQALPPAPPAQTGTGVVRGRVVRAGDGGSIADAQVFLNRGTTPGPVAGARGAGPGGGAPRMATSDREGSFEFRELAPGRYTVSVQRTGYSGPFMNSPDPSVSVAVSNGETSDAVVTMTPTGVIRGRVRDASGAFLSNIAVDAIEVAFRNSLPYLMPVVSKATDDRGEYRLYGLPPGDYYVAATPRPLSAIAARAGGDRSAKTFFPGAVDVNRATRITIHGGEEITSIDIGLQTPQAYKVSGTVSTTIAPAGPRPDAQGAFAVIQQTQNARINMLLVSRDPAQPQDERNGSSGIVVPATSAGPFEIANVLPGSYDLLALFGENTGNPAIARTVIDIRNQDVGGISLTIRPGYEVRGKITVDGKAPDVNMIRMAFEPADALRRLGVAAPANLAPDGAFTSPQLPDGRFRVVVRAQPDLYVEDVKQAGQSVFDSGFEIRGANPDPIEVSFKSGAATFDGTLQDAAGKPLIAGSVALVPLTRRDNPLLYYSAAADSSGAFAIRGITPGEYKLFAWDYMPPGAASNATFLEKYEDKGIGVSFAAGARMTQKVTAIPR